MSIEPPLKHQHRAVNGNTITVRGFFEPRTRYQIGSEMSEPDGILVRSADLHSTPIPPSLKAIGRAGVGVNNIPVAELSRRGVPVFNAPGANANAVKEPPPENSP